MKGCHFKDAPEAEVALKMVLLEVTHGGF